LESHVSEVRQDFLRGTQCVGRHEILKGVSLLLRCVGFETCVAVSGFRESRCRAEHPLQLGVEINILNGINPYFS
jgi:hypothetical protein